MSYHLSTAVHIYFTPASYQQDVVEATAQEKDSVGSYLPH